MSQNMKRLLTGLKPTSDQLHFGNYFGAIVPLLEYQNNADMDIFLFVANLHALTTIHDGKKLSHNTLQIIKIYLACGIDPERATIYNQAMIPAHTQLQWLLSCVTHLGFIERMHAYKDAVNKGKVNEINMGTLSYPILMAADILLYDADLVPVGKDQKQHVEFARDIAQKFNATFGECFTLPAPLIQDHLATIPGIDGRKMSKSYNNFIGLIDDEKTLLKKVKAIATETKTVEEPKDPTTCHVYALMKLFLTSEEQTHIRTRYETGISYKEIKEIAYEKISSFVKPIRERFFAISDEHVINIITEHTEKVKEKAEKKIAEIYKRTGLKI